MDYEGNLGWATAMGGVRHWGTLDIHSALEILWALRGKGGYDGGYRVCLDTSDGCNEGRDEVDSAANRVNLLVPVSGGAERRKVPAHIAGAVGVACR